MVVLFRFNLKSKKKNKKKYSSSPLRAINDRTFEYTRLTLRYSLIKYYYNLYNIDIIINIMSCVAIANVIAQHELLDNNQYNNEYTE